MYGPVYPIMAGGAICCFGCASFIFYCGCTAAFIHFQADLLAVCATGVTVGWITRQLHSRYLAALVAIIFCSYIAVRSIIRPSFEFRPFWDVFRDSAVALGISVLFFFISWSELGSTRTGFMALYFLSGLVALGSLVAYYAGVAVPLSFGFSPSIGTFTRWLLFRGGVREGLEEMTEHNTLNKTITFEGTVSHEPGKACVVSWPGKYATAWDHMVASARAGQTSAAVVFLPEGTKNFGKHSRIPTREGLDGRCWCEPLYGEKKPWGCRWWALWIQNVEAAVKHRAELQVYFFAGACGKGKVGSFETAGQENLRREALLKKMRDFEDTDSFRDAEEAGLNKLSRLERYDSSSQYSREKYRLFLQWLPDSERQFLQDSEGLGNSQKAEVAWLEKKGYRYTSVDISRWLKQPRELPEDREHRWAWKPEPNSLVGHPVVCNELPSP
ncbi:unnamed protein product [Symbiodinium necroappetens]|uniref:Uncharacterized protein n=1 Tax=Symbiodinium necroappetens TaxID=1628268 RepID=A0A812XZ07_9DINO|nr:unnamed protein product [Symbiodinium necroappetens]